MQNSTVKLGYIGLGKMGINMVERLMRKGHKVVAYDVNEDAREAVLRTGAQPVSSLKALVNELATPRKIWIMVPHAAVESVLEELVPLLDEGDLVIDGGNSNYKETLRRAEELPQKGVRFMDVGVSGGPDGARNGACMMIGGSKEDFELLEPLFTDLTTDHGYAYMGKSGSGHFVKMVHNGIEYGMMQAIAEGFHIMRESDFDLHLKDVADIYNHGSVIESRLIGWLKEGYDSYGVDLDVISGTVGHSGEGEWTVKTAQDIDVPAPIIEGAFQFRVQSEENPSYAGRVLSTLRNMFGGHPVKKKNEE